MKGTWKRGLLGALSVMLLCFLPAQALNWDGSSSGGSESTNVGNGGFGIADSVAANNVVGYRFSVVDDSGKTIYASKDIFRNTTNGNRAMGSEGRRFYRFRSKYNKEQLIDRQNQGFSTEYTLTNSFRESQMGFTSALPVPSGLETWQNSGTNMNRVLKLWNSSTNALIYGSKVLVEPIIIVQIKHTWHVLTVTELALTGKAMFGAGNNGGSSSNSGSWGFIAAYTNKHFPNLLYASQGYGIWTGVGALSRQATFYDIINKGYGVGVAYTQKQNKIYTLTVNYYSNGASSGTGGVFPLVPCRRVKTYWYVRRCFTVTPDTVKGWPTTPMPAARTCFFNGTATRELGIGGPPHQGEPWFTRTQGLPVVLLWPRRWGWTSARKIKP